MVQNPPVRATSLGACVGLVVALGGRVLVSVVRLGIQAWRRTHPPVTGRGTATANSPGILGSGYSAGAGFRIVLPTAPAPPDVTVGLGPQANFATTPKQSHSLQRPLRGNQVFDPTETFAR